MRGPNWTLVEVPLSGVDKFTDAPHVAANQLQDAVNVRFREPPKASKRYGHRFLPALDLSNTPMENGRRLHAHQKQALACCDRNLFVLAETAGRWADRGRLSEFLLERLPVYHDQAFDRKNADLAYNQGHLLVAWPAGPGELTAVIIDTNSNSVVQTIENSTSGGGQTTSWVRCVAIGDYIYLFSDFDAVSNSIKYRRVLTTDPQLIVSLVASVTLTSGLASSVFPDICAISSSVFATVYKSTPGGAVVVDLFNTSTHTVTNTASMGAATALSVAVEGVSGENVYVGWENAAIVKAAVLNATTLGTVIAATTISDTTGNAAPRIGIARVSATKRAYVWERPDVTGAGYTFAQTRTNTFTNAGAIGVATGSELRDVTPFSKPFARDGGVYVWVGFHYQDPSPASYPAGLVNYADDEPTAYLAEVVDDGGNLMESARWVGTAARGVAKGPQPGGFLASVWTVDTDIFECAATCNYKQRFANESDQTITIARAGVYRFRMDFANEARFEAASWGDSVFLAGAKPTMFDGFSAHEHNFAWYPARWIETQTSSGSGKLNAGGTATHLWCLVYEWEDALGQIHRSTPSRINTTAMGVGKNEITIDLREELWATHGGAGFAWAALTKVRVVAYRTIADGTRLYRDSVLGTDAAFSSSIVIGGASSPTDADLQLNDPLYTDGDILDNEGGPPCGLVCYHEDRLFLGKLEEANEIAASQPFVQGEAPRFNEALRFTVDEKPTAIAGLDEKLVIWSERNIFVVGDCAGPPATGGLTGWRADLVSSETGCTEPRSVCLTRDGLGFMGSKGYALLNRGLQVEWIGLPAKGYFDTYSEITSAAVDSDGEHLIISAKRGNAPTTSVRHVYNLTTKQWTIDLILVGVIADAAVIWDGSKGGYRHAFLLDQGQGYIEDEDVWTDGSAGTKVTWSITTAWLKMQEILQAWQFVRNAYLFGEFSECWGFSVEVGYDYDNAYTTTYTYDAAKLATLTRDQVVLDFEFMTCQAVRLRITELFDPLVENYEYGGPQIRSIVLDAGVAPDGGFRIESAGRL